MEREIKLRGKRHDGEWVYGFGHQSGAYEGMLPFRNESGDLDAWFVKPETVGQLTGLKDKNGVEIFEGDVIDHCACYGSVVFEDGMFSLSSSAQVNFGTHRQPISYIDVNLCEVIGNIHDSPELLEVSK